ncbi:MAG: hypothetical protein NTZ13_00580 [Candidatus Parcubacteria bacterium]|nr:hypothetical protein [Candidatus Parcubacteria bacterium]
MLFIDLKVGEKFFFLNDLLAPEGVRIREKTGFSEYRSHDNGALHFGGFASSEVVVKLKG